MTKATFFLYITCHMFITKKPFSDIFKVKRLWAVSKNNLKITIHT